MREGRTTLEKAQYQRTKVRANFPSAIVTVGSETGAMAAPFVFDQFDVHVAACAMTVAPSTLLTFNIKHFDVEGLARTHVTVRKPGPWLRDAFMATSIESQQDWLRALDAHRLTLQRPPVDRAGYVTQMATSSMTSFAEVIRAPFLQLP